MSRLGIACWIAALLLALRSAEGAEGTLHYETDIRPILKTHCFHCHGEEPTVEGKFDIRLVRFQLKGGESGPALKPGSAAESLLWQRIEKGEMPPKGKGLSDAEKQVIVRWINEGAQTRRPEPETLDASNRWTDEERSFWSLQPVVRPAVPAPVGQDQVRTAIDAFLLTALEAKGLKFSPEADRVTLIRRLYFDLVGIPPSPEEVADFVQDPSADATERLIDRLLASPAYGERWARHWLDTAGYADSDGYTETDPERPWAFRYRDYVISAINRDKPFDQFVIEQLAGDELIAPPYENLSPEATEKLAATGFLRMAPDGTGDGAVDANVARNDCVAETIKIVSTSLMGLTVGCAQCHDHRYDPISQSDYFRFRAVFDPALDWKNWREKPARLISLWQPADREAAAAVDKQVNEINATRGTELTAIVEDVFEKEVAKIPAEKQTLAREGRKTPADKRTPEHLALLKEYPSLNVDNGSVILYDGARINEHNAKFDKLIAEARAKRPADSYVACLTEVPGHIPPTFVFFRGDFNQPREKVAPGDLSVLGSTVAIPEDDPALPTTGRRLALAKYLVNGKHPLVGRVQVNRAWMHLFGQGLVTSPGDFGFLGQKPSNPALLDWLADDLVATGWQMKRLHRLLVSSHAYRQNSLRNDPHQAVDPENHLLGRMNVRRLEAEAIRDSMLEVSGMRLANMFGPASPVNPDDVGQAIVGKATRDGNGLLVAKFEDNLDQCRRSIYIQVRRSMPLGMLEPFDTATLSPNCDRRNSSTVAPQSLLMMNNRMTIEFSEKFAARVLKESGDDIAAEAKRAWWLAFGREPSEAQVSKAAALIQAQRAYFEEQAAKAAAATPMPMPMPGTPAPLDPKTQALAVYCQALLSSNSFLYVD
ncbi:MAG: PSD1 and planctomycete cytochrome C domain-containing protein [Planctomycetaceae bacterium]